MDQFPMALYRMPGREPHELGGITSMLVHSQAELDAQLADGWFASAPEAKAAFDAAQKKPPSDDEPPTREELETKAAELGLKFDGRTSDKKLRDMIAAAIEE